MQVLASSSLWASCMLPLASVPYITVPIWNKSLSQTANVLTKDYKAALSSVLKLFVQCRSVYHKRYHKRHVAVWVDFAIILSCLPPLFPPRPISFIPIWVFWKACSRLLNPLTFPCTVGVHQQYLSCSGSCKIVVVNFLFKIVFLSVEEKITGMLGCKLFGESSVNTRLE